MFSDCPASICYDTIRGGNDRVYADFVTMGWHGPSLTSSNPSVKRAFCVCVQKNPAVRHTLRQAFKPTLQCAAQVLPVILVVV